MKKTILEEEINSITLKKDAKGNFNWEIKIYGDDMETITEKIKCTNSVMAATYGGQTGI
jgi:hypothetical protein